MREKPGNSVFFHEETYCDSELHFIKLFYDYQATDLLRSLFVCLLSTSILPISGNGVDIFVRRSNLCAYTQPGNNVNLLGEWFWILHKTVSPKND